MNLQQAYYYATKIKSFNKDEQLASIISSSNMEVYPHQIASATFGLKRFSEFSLYPNFKNDNKRSGVLLCDEGGLGKTYTAMMMIATRYNLGDNKILVVVPNQLIFQWIDVFENSFNIPYIILKDKNQMESYINNDEVIITTFNMIREHTDYYKQLNFEIVVVDEAHKLKSGKAESLLYSSVKDISSNAFKILLTATPIQNSILDIYNLAKLIDDTLFDDAESFYNRYHRREENYGELSKKIKQIAFRTLRQEVADYINLPERISMSLEYDYNENELKLYKLLESYISLDNKVAFPKMDKYDLTLMLTKAFSSSNTTFLNMLMGIQSRLEEGQKDKVYIDEMINLCNKIKNSSKVEVFDKVLYKVFKELKAKKLNEKVIIFTEYRNTLEFLFNYLNKGKLKDKVLTFDSKNSNENIKELFINSDCKVLITTDLASDGFNFNFANCVINYDIPYNILKVEQRANRIHRMGQHGESVLINFFNEQNFYDVRILELIKKRVLQFNSIMGSSDNFIGEFLTIDECFEKIESLNTYDEISNKFLENQKNKKDEIEYIEKLSSHFLYTSFSKEVRDKVTLTPKVIEDSTSYLKENLWNFTKCFFNGKSGFTLDDETKSVIPHINVKSPFTGKALKGSKYSILDNSVSKACKHTITGTLTKSIVDEILWQGVKVKSKVITCNTSIEKCTLALYKFEIKSKSNMFFPTIFYRFIGKSGDRILSHKECVIIIETDFLSYKENGEKVGDKNRHLVNIKSDLENYIEVQVDECVNKYLTEIEEDSKLSIEKQKDLTEYKKQDIEKNINLTYKSIKELDKEREEVTSKIQVLEINKKKNVLLRDLKKQEEKVYFEKMKIDLEFEKFLEEMKHCKKVEVKKVLLFEMDID